MRISVRPDDPGYRSDATKYRAYLDWVEIDRCFTADEDTGEAFIFEVDEYGNCVLETHDTIKEKRLTGKVEIRKVV